MPISIWDWVRAKTRDAVLAGINDAMEIADQGQTSSNQHDAANQLRSRLSPTEARSLPEPSQNGNGHHEKPEPQSLAVEAPVRPSEPADFDDELERRIDAAVPQVAAKTPPGTTPRNQITNRKRGRPPKTQEIK